MHLTLTPQQLLPNPQSAAGTPELNLDEIQGDVLIGLQKFFQRLLFFKIRDIATFKYLLRRQIARRITTTREVHRREFELARLKNEGSREQLALAGLNLAFTSAGLELLVPGADLGDPSFKAGARAMAPKLNDSTAGDQLTNWLAPYLADDIHGVLNVTGGTYAAAAREAQEIIEILGASIEVLITEEGETRPGAERGHEHFGWLDGISQPGIKGLSDPNPGQDMLDPGLFVFGYPTAAAAPAAGAPPAWAANGSFMVFRRLQQLVPEFDAFLLSQADALGMDPVLLGARMLGRWKSGAPLSLTPSQDDLTIGQDPANNNDFDNADDPAQRRCPFAAHIRKTNPRKDIPEKFLDSRRIIRAGIPFGPELTDTEKAPGGKTEQQRGLLFICYQTSIVNQFEFLQITWANNKDFVKPGIGIDPIIGQSQSPDRARKADAPIPNYPAGNVPSTLNMPQDFVVPTGGGYFFVPSISAITQELTN